LGDMCCQTWIFFLLMSVSQVRSRPHKNVKISFLKVNFRVGDKNKHYFRVVRENLGLEQVGFFDRSHFTLVPTGTGPLSRNLASYFVLEHFKLLLLQKILLSFWQWAIFPSVNRVVILYENLFEAIYC
jgi:hypothetical protein